MIRSAQLVFGITLVGAMISPSVVGAQSPAQALVPATSSPASNVPRTVPFNGQVLTAAGEPRSGTVLLTFGLYTEQKDGAPLWTEQQLLRLDTDGRYSAMLGSASANGLPIEAFAAGTPKWLGVQVESEPEQPRFMLLSVPYALKAADADTVGGKSVSDFVTASHLSDSVQSAMKESNATPAAPFTTPNALVKYVNSGGATGESSILDVGGRLGVGVSSPVSELDVLGGGSTTTLTLRNGGKAADVAKLVGSDGSLRIGSATNANLINLIGPNVGIGTTTPTSPLTVSTDAFTAVRITNSNQTIANPYGLFSVVGSAPVFLLAPVAVQGLSDAHGVGVFGASEVGVYGYSPAGGSFSASTGVWGRSADSGFGVRGSTATGSGRPPAFVGTAGVWGDSGPGVGVYGTSDTNYAVAGVGGSGGKAGYFGGDVVVTSNLQAGTVRIDNYVTNNGGPQLCTSGSTNLIGLCSSSLRYKTDVERFRRGLDVIARLRPIAFTWKDGGLRDVGLGAEDVAQVDPLFTFTNANGDVEGVKYPQLSAVFINAFQEQQAQILDDRDLMEQLQAQLGRQQEQIARQQAVMTEQQQELAALRQLVCRSYQGDTMCK